MRTNSRSIAECPGAELFEHLSSRWSMLLVMTLAGGSLRFHELRDRLDGISDKMLSQTLKVLVRDGLIHRTVDWAASVQVTYALSALGEDLDEQFQGLRAWIGSRLPAVQKAQSRFDTLCHPPGVTRHRIS